MTSSFAAERTASKLFLALILLSVVGCGQSNSTRHVAADIPTAMKIRAALVEGAGSEGAEEDAGTLAEPTGWASLTGTFTFNGSIPDTQFVPTITADCQQVSSNGVPVNDLVVDPATMGIANILIMVDSIPEPWIRDEARSAAEPEVVFDQKACTYLSRVVGVHTSQQLKIMNSDPFGHNTKLSPRSNRPFNGTIPPTGVIYQPEKLEKSPFEVACSIHPWMKSWMIFRDNMYFAVTSADGTFEIPHLPTGVPLEFRVWQERSSWLEDVQVAAPNSLAGKPWKKGRFTLTLAPNDDASNRLDVTVDASAL